ncbi:hypothetical protein Slin14017_G060790 [Septoria linicola]|nr:hypothetical protein Slin14017_G060790 [Septoria linicola]
MTAFYFFDGPAPGHGVVGWQLMTVVVFRKSLNVVSVLLTTQGFVQVIGYGTVKVLVQYIKVGAEVVWTGSPYGLGLLPAVAAANAVKEIKKIWKGFMVKLCWHLLLHIEREQVHAA